MVEKHLRMNESEKHVDNHTHLKTDKNYLLVGCDGGLYESFDKTKTGSLLTIYP